MSADAASERGQQVDKWENTTMEMMLGIAAQHCSFKKPRKIGIRELTAMADRVQRLRQRLQGDASDPLEGLLASCPILR